MNFAHLHLVLTHFPPVLSLAGAFSAAVGVFRRRRELIQLSLLLLIVVGAMMPLVYVAGDRAADNIGKVDGVQQDAIAPHQHAAAIALTISIFTAIVAAALAVIDRRRAGLSQRFQILALAAAIVSAAPIAWTANLGGAIHHPEIRSPSP